MSGIRVFNAAIQQFQRSQQNLSSIKMAREKHARDGELFDLKKQEAEIKLDSAKLEGSMTENDYKFQKAQMDEYFKQNKKIQEGNTAQIDMAEQESAVQAKQAKDVAAGLVKNDPLVQDYVSNYLEPVSVGGHVGFRRRQAKAKTLKDTDNYQIFEAANKMASEDIGDIETPYDQKVQKYLPKAREMILGTTKQSEAKPKKIKMKAPNGKIGYIDSGKAEEAKRRGFTAVQ